MKSMFWTNEKISLIVTRTASVSITLQSWEFYGPFELGFWEQQLISSWREILVSLCYCSHCWENVFKPILCVQCDFIIINPAVICTAYESDVYPWFLADSDGFGTIEQPLEIIKSIGRSFTQTKPNPSVVLMRVMFILDSFMQTWKVANGMAWRTAKQLRRVKSAALYSEF